MSINSLTDQEVRPRPQPIAGPTPMMAPDARPASPPQDSQISHALETLTKYIPTEVITLYVAAVSAIQSLPTKEQIAPIAYWTAVILTPIFFVLVLMNKRASRGEKPIPEQWPWWRIAAATIAFLVWALAVPGNPYITTDALHVVAGFGALFVSTILSLLDPIFVRPQS